MTMIGVVMEAIGSIMKRLVAKVREDIERRARLIERIQCGDSTRSLGAPECVGFPPASEPCARDRPGCRCLPSSARPRTQLSLPPLDPRSALSRTDIGLIGGGQVDPAAAGNCTELKPRAQLAGGREEGKSARHSPGGIAGRIGIKDVPLSAQGNSEVERSTPTDCVPSRLHRRITIAWEC